MTQSQSGCLQLWHCIMGAHYWLITLPEHDSSPGSVFYCEPRSPIPSPSDCPPELAEIMPQCWDANADA
jgi:hypothetical protein